jgi:hypothetical protein
MDALTESQHDKRSAQGRRWQRDHTPTPLHHLVIHPTDGVLTLPDGQQATFVIQQLVPAEGWKARYRDEEGGLVTEALTCFALALLTCGDQTSPGILGIDYSPEDGWQVCNAYDNFVALVDPWNDDDEEDP